MMITMINFTSTTTIVCR